MGADIYQLLDRAEQGKDFHSQDPYFKQDIEEHLQRSPDDHAYLCVKAVCYWHGWGGFSKDLTEATKILCSFTPDREQPVFIVLNYYLGLAYTYGHGHLAKGLSTASHNFYEVLTKAATNSKYFRLAENEARPIIAEFLNEDAMLNDDQAAAFLVNRVGCYLWYGYTVASVDKKRAVKYFIRAAERGCTSAQYNLALDYEHGLSIGDEVIVEKNIKLAIKYHSLALESNNLANHNIQYAVNALKRISKNNKDEGLSLESNTPASREMFRVLGKCYLKGEGCKLNIEKGLNYLIAVARQGDVKAQAALFIELVKISAKNPDNKHYKSLLAMCYVEEWGIQGQQRDGLSMFVEVSKDDSLDKPQWDIAHYYIGYASENGLWSYSENISDAIWRYNRAIHVEPGDQHIKEQVKQKIIALMPRLHDMANDENKASGRLFLSIGIMYGRGKAYPVDNSLALKYYEKAAGKGACYGFYNSGNSYFNGNGASKDYAKAIVYYSKALEYPDLRQSVAMTAFNDVIKITEEKSELYTPVIKAMIGFCYLNGIGTAKDQAKGIALLKEAAQVGCEKAQYYLGLAYEEGNGVTRCLNTASYWYLLAATHNTQNENGTIKAVQRLAALANQEKATVENILCLQRYATCLQEGYGIARNESEAIKYIEVAKDLGGSGAWETLINKYLQPGPVQDINKAVDYIAQALQNHNFPVGTKENLLQKLDQIADMLLASPRVEGNSSSMVGVGESISNDTVNAVLALGKIYLQHSKNNLTFRKKACDYYIGLWRNRKISDEQLNKVSQDLLGHGKDDNFSLVRTFCAYVFQSDEARCVDLIYHCLAISYKDSNTPDLKRSAYNYFQAIKHGIKDSAVRELSFQALLALAKNAEQPNAAASYYVGLCYELGYGVEADAGNAHEHYSQALNIIQQAPIHIDVDNEGKLFHALVDQAIFNAINNNEFSQIDNLIIFCRGSNITQPETGNNYLHVLVEKAGAEIDAASDRKKRIVEARMKEEVLDLPEIQLHAFNALKELLSTKKIDDLIKQKNNNDKTPVELARDSRIIEIFTDFYQTDDKDDAHYNQSLYSALVAGNFVAVLALKEAGASHEYCENKNNIFHILASVKRETQRDYDNYIKKYISLYSKTLFDNEIEAKEFMADLILKKNEDNKSPLNLAVEQDNQHAIVVFCDLLKWNQLHLSVYLNDSAGIQQAMGKDDNAKAEGNKLSINKARDYSGKTPISLAGDLGYWHLIQYILPAKGSINRGDRRLLGQVLYWAVVQGQAEVAEQLLELGASTKWQPIPPKGSVDPLMHIAIKENLEKVIDLFLRYKESGRIDFKALSTDGKTLLQVAVESKNKAVLERILILVPESIDVLQQNSDGQTVFDIIKLKRISAPEQDIPAEWKANPDSLTAEQLAEMGRITLAHNKKYRAWEAEDQPLAEMLDLIAAAQERQEASIAAKAASKFSPGLKGKVADSGDSNIDAVDKPLEEISESPVKQQQQEASLFSRVIDRLFPGPSVISANFGDSDEDIEMDGGDNYVPQSYL
jgi:TPR repeat protein/ankyrin repeat protein